jgi:glycosyltransferase involved in cell wall biosynthesis
VDMKVVQVLPDLNSGGVEKGTLEVADALVKAGHQSLVISAGGKLVDLLEEQGSRHISWNLGKKSPFTFLKYLALRRWLKEEKPDIIHVRSRMPAWVVWLAWRGMDKATRPRLVTTVHGMYSVSWYSEIMCKGERVIAVSKTIKKYISDSYPNTDMSKVELIYRGVDPDEFPYGYKPDGKWLEKWHGEYPQTKGKLLVTLPGRLTRLKGHHEFIDIIKGLKEKGLNVHGLVVGSEDPKRPEYAKEIKLKVKANNLNKDITFTGGRTDIREVFSISDLVLSLSTKPEAFGRTVCEALALGVPVFSYRYGGAEEILEKLFPQGLGDIGCDRLRKVLSILEGGGGVAENLFFLKKEMLGKTLAVYEELMGAM